MTGRRRDPSAASAANASWYFRNRTARACLSDSIRRHCDATRAASRSLIRGAAHSLPGVLVHKAAQELAAIRAFFPHDFRAGRERRIRGDHHAPLAGHDVLRAVEGERTRQTPRSQRLAEIRAAQGVGRVFDEHSFIRVGQIGELLDPLLSRSRFRPRSASLLALRMIVQSVFFVGRMKLPITFVKNMKSLDLYIVRPSTASSADSEATLHK